MASQLSSRARAIASEVLESDCVPGSFLGVQALNKATTLNLRTAENWLVREELIRLYHELVREDLDPSDLSYGSGFGGDPDLLEAAADLMNTYFNPAQAIDPDDVVITTGASLCLDALMFTLCDEGDQVLITAPYWTGFDQHLVLRTGVELLPIHAPSADLGLTRPEDLLKGSLVPSLTEAYESSTDPSRVKALVMTNPHNPYGRFYPESVIREAMMWCAERNIHYVSDEVYALSQLTAPDEQPGRGATHGQEQHPHREHPFISALSVRFSPQDEAKVPEISVVWGTSKDLGSSGFRVGVYVHRQPPGSGPSRASHNAGSGAAASGRSGTNPLERSPLTTTLSNLTTSHLPTLTTSLLTKGLFTSPMLPRLFQLNRTRLRDHYALPRSYLQKWRVPYVEVQGAPFVLARLACALPRVRGTGARDTGTQDSSAEARGGAEPLGCTWEDEEYLVETLLRAGVTVALGRQYHMEKKTDSRASGGDASHRAPDNKRAGWVRITFAVPIHVLEDGIARIATVLGLED
ncbi:pyridoxal phosphate-dependent transferase [Nemania sp. NC0429]|nr:pyridoxal phosphate-dependent transferase [Nemania sp. NC0429]